MATFVLVHGAWHGGWCWREVRAGLEEHGHRTFAPTMTGLGERKHLLSPDISIDILVKDLVNVLEYERLEEVVLVGHSFGGAVLPGVAECARGRIAKLVFLDAAVLEDGESIFAMVDPEIVEERMRAAKIRHDGLAIPLPTQADLGITDDQLWNEIEGLLTPHPIATYESPIRLSGKPGAGMKCEYIQCTSPEYAPLAWARERARSYGWPTRDIATGHDAMLTAPSVLVEMLLASAREFATR
ncbi:alpha/beta hydrolase [Qipengyuania sp. YG27]|uniref:Alpha/beta hydrolase n=1 Tax=Qipengyuania mesophila TaxID=2867246 RepID=A0ABS7JXL9_9SPHN|nr:alpha/beta fold hydrolase [Qipengyuania mesophila]MBX7502402.1 alpha/beta hydrolase [Qipengyuania mesophila]